MPLFEGPDEVLWGKFRSRAALKKAAVTSLHKDKAVRAHKARLGDLYVCNGTEVF